MTFLDSYQPHKQHRVGVGPEEALKRYAWANQHPNISYDQLQSTRRWNGKYWEEPYYTHPVFPDREGVQQRLIREDQVPRPEAHHQTPDAFSADPRTWWHGRVTGTNPRLTRGGSTEGFHAGSQQSARVRLDANVRRRGLASNKVGHLFPLRITGTTVNTPEDPQADRDRHRGLGNMGSGYFYRNEVEDRGSISVGVPKREGFLSTHREMVEAALKRGEYVHPNVVWAARKARPLKERVPDPWRGQPQVPGEGGAQRRIPGVEAQMGAPQSVVRSSYQTEGGRTKHVYRFTDAPEKMWHSNT